MSPFDILNSSPFTVKVMLDGSTGVISSKSERVISGSKLYITEFGAGFGSDAIGPSVSTINLRITGSRISQPSESVAEIMAKFMVSPEAYGLGGV
jgi:hypothetical protein